MRITERTDTAQAFVTSLSFSRRNTVIAEAYAPGLQLSTEGVCYRGECHTACWSERNYDRLEQFAPNVIEDGGVLPATLSEDDVAAVKDVMQAAADAMGITDGPVKGDLVLTENGPVVVEIAARLSGGYLCTDQIPWARGVDLVRQTIKLALGEELERSELVPEHRGYIGVRFFFPEPGVVESIEGFEELGAEPWILKRMMYVEPGDVVEATTSHPTRAGFVFTTADTPEEAERRAIECTRRVRIVTR